jgi:hypothetical protein
MHVYDMVREKKNMTVQNAQIKPEKAESEGEKRKHKPREGKRLNVLSVSLAPPCTKC